MSDNQYENQVEIVREALRHTELRLKGLEAFADNADRRAAVLIAGSLAFSGFLWSSTEQLDGDICMFISAALALSAAGFAVLSLVPKSFHTAGHFWRHWKDHIDDNDDLLDVLISQASENDTRLDYNEIQLRKSARMARFSILLLVISSITALVSQVYVVVAGVS